MLIRKLTSLAAMATLGLIAFGSVSATAVTNARIDPSGAILGGGAVSGTSSDGATLTLSGFGTIQCSGGGGYADVGSSGGATVSGRLTVLGLTSCTDTLPVIAVNSCYVHNIGVPTVTITATSGAGGSVVVANTLVRCGIAGNPNGCYYRAATANGTASNLGSTLAFSGVAMTHTASGTTDDLGAVCGNNGSFSATATGVRTTTGLNPITVTTS